MFILLFILRLYYEKCSIFEKNLLCVLCRKKFHVLFLCLFSALYAKLFDEFGYKAYKALKICLDFLKIVFFNTRREKNSYKMTSVY